MNLFSPKERPVKEDLIGLQLLNVYSFWSRKRVLFNIIVAIAAISATLLATHDDFYLDDLISPVIFLLGSNVLYGIGYAIDSFIIVKSNGQKSLGQYRMALFATGIFLYALMGGILLFGYLMSIPPIS